MPSAPNTRWMSLLASELRVVNRKIITTENRRDSFHALKWLKCLRNGFRAPPTIAKYLCKTQFLYGSAVQIQELHRQLLNFFQATPEFLSGNSWISLRHSFSSWISSHDGRQKKRFIRWRTTRNNRWRTTRNKRHGRRQEIIDRNGEKEKTDNTVGKEQ